MILRVGLVGAGAMGAHHAATVATDPASRLVRIVDEDPAKARALAARWGVPRADADSAPDPHDRLDVVIVASPATTHLALAAPWLAAGTHVHVEKPLAADALEALALLSPRVSVGFCERFSPAWHGLGPIGPSHIAIERLCPPGPRGLDVDVLADLAQHDLDAIFRQVRASHLQPLEVSGDEHEVDASFVVGDLTVQARWSRRAPTRRRLWTVTPQDGLPFAIDLLAGTRTPSPEAPQDDADALRRQWTAVRAHLAGERTHLATAWDGLRAARAADRLRLARVTVRPGPALPCSP